jgi:hypothetical protein
MEQGTGKTKVIIDNAAYLYAQDKITALVVVAPNGVHRNWLRKEIPAHMPDWCITQSAYYAAGMSAKDLDKFKEVMSAQDCLRIFSFNCEAFVSKKAIELMGHSCCQTRRCWLSTRVLASNGQEPSAPRS